MNAVRSALGNSLLLGFGTATIGVVLMGLLAWLIYRSRLPGSGLIEYVVMFPQAVPRLVFAFGLMWAWVVFPIPIYGTLWLLLIAYLTVFLPLGVRTIAGVMLQIDKSLEECAQMCGASWAFRVRTVTIPLLVPGLVAAWLLLFIASVRELGASILLMGPHSKVITPSIVESWFGDQFGTHRGAGADPDAGGRLRHGRACRRHAPRRRASASSKDVRNRHHASVADIAARAAHRGRQARNALRQRSGGARRQFQRPARRATDAARPLRLRQDHHACARSPVSSSRPRAKSASTATPVYSSERAHQHPRRETRPVDGVPVLCHLAAHDRVRERRLWTARAANRGGGDHRKGAPRARHGADAQLRDRGGRRSCPADSSSGSRWRARSCSQPSVLLFDEPLSNLDAKLRADMRIELRELQHRLGITSVYVTHDLEEALAMSDRIVVMRDGLIEQTGTPDEIYRLPQQRLRRGFRRLRQPHSRPPSRRISMPAA